MTEKGSLIDWLESIGLAKHLNNADILSGVMVNQVLTKMMQNYHVRLGETNTAATRIENWNTVVKQLQKVGIHVGQQQKSKIINGDDKVVYNILYELKELYSRHKKEVGVNINQIDLRTDPKNATSLLELLILLLVKYFGLSVKQSVALLSNDSKYLAHILAKGFKDSSIQVEGLLSQLIKLLPQVVLFCKNKQNLIFFVKSFKPGLISKYLSLSEMTVQLLTQFLKTTDSKYELIKQQLISTYLLSIRRHPCQITAISNSIIDTLSFNKNILDLLLANASLKQTAQFMIEMVNRAQISNQESEIVAMFNFQQFLNRIIEAMRNSELFVNCGHLVIKILEINYSHLWQSRELLVKVLQNLSALSLSKKSDIFIQTGFIFSFLTILGKKKNALAPQFFKLAVEKYKNTLNLDQSENYLHNFISVCEIFPSIPRIGIVQAILFRSQTGSCNIAELQLQIIEGTINQMQEATVLRTYNIVTKLFMEQVGKQQYISPIIQNIVKNFESKIVMDLSIKFVKVCLAVFYANLRKLNYSKSLVEGTIKLNPTNAFYKAKNNEIVQLLKRVVSVNDEVLNKAIEPLVCYSFFQSQIKNKEEAQELKQVMKMFGPEEELRSMYQQDARHLLDQVKKEQKKGVQKNTEFKRLQAKTRVNSDVLLLSKKKDHIYYNNQQISTDAKDGLQRYSKAFKSRIAKIQLQQQQKRAQEIKMQFLKKKATLKVLEKGLKITKQLVVNCIYEFDAKQRQLERQEFNSLDHLPFYDPSLQEQRDVKGIQILLKKYAPVLKVYYHNYGGKLRPNTIPLFDDISQTGYLMQSANVWKLLREHDLDLFISVKEVHFTIQRINAHLKKDYKDSSLLDYEVFENFIVQAAIIMFSRPPKDLRSRPLLQMLNEMIKNLKDKAGQNKIDQKLFQQQRDDFKVQSEKMQELKEINEQLAQNSDYILPEGYKKIVKKNVVYDYLVKVQNQQIKSQFSDVLEIIDGIMFEKFGFHIIQAHSQLKVQATARPLLYKNNYERTIKERSLSSILPKNNKETNGKTQQQQQTQNEGLQKSEEQIERTKLQNKIIKQKKQKQLQLKRLKEQEDKKRQNRDKQLKALLEKYKQRQSELEKQKEQHQEQKKRQEQLQKDNKKKYEEQLKKKVEQYTKLRQQQKQKEDSLIKQKKDQEHRKLLKLKEDVEKKKKMVQESKLKKKQQQTQKQQAQRIEKQRKEQQQRKKIEGQKENKKRMILEFRQRKQKQQEQKSKQKAKAKQPQEKLVKSKVKEKKQDQKQKQKQKKPKNKIQQVTIQQVDRV